jgi:hypothetical protein
VRLECREGQPARGRIDAVRIEDLDFAVAQRPAEDERRPAARPGCAGRASPAGRQIERTIGVTHEREVRLQHVDRMQTETPLTARQEIA